MDGILILERNRIAPLGDIYVREKPPQISLRTALLAALTSVLCLGVALQPGWLEGETWMLMRRFSSLVPSNRSELNFPGTEQQIRSVSLEVFQALQRLGNVVPRNVPTSGTLDCRHLTMLERQDGSVMGGWRSPPYFVTGCTVFISAAYQGSDRYAVMVDGATVNGSYRSINGRLGLTMADLNKERKSRVLQQYFERLSAALDLLTKNQMIALFQFPVAACEQLNLNDARGNPISSWAARPASVASCVIVSMGQRLTLTVAGSASVDGQVYTRTFQK